MNVLWITNILFPEAQRLMSGKGDLKASGGWMLGMIDALLQNTEIQLSVASVSPLVKKLTIVEGLQIKYYVLPYGNGNLKNNPDYEIFWKDVYSYVKPEIVHIHGTEFTHGLAYVNACGPEKVVVSIQGLVSVYARYYLAGITKSEIYKNLTFHSLLKGSLLRGQMNFEKRGILECKLLSKVSHVIGRTSWDCAHVRAISPKASYNFCNETLRSEFYNADKWDYRKCNKHSIFLSQAGYPIKGLHQVLKAMPMILQYYPDTIVCVAGVDITDISSLPAKLRLSGYGFYIKRLISKYNLEGKIFFRGSLDATGMICEYLKCNVFLCPSSIENSPNSLGEAQILGVPCVASYVGGIPDMMQGNEENLYRFEEVEMLAEKVCNIFSNKDKQVSMIPLAEKRHNPKENANQLYKIYNLILRQ